MKSILNFVSHSKKGLKRKINQDRILILEKNLYYLFIVFDGVSSLPTSHHFINYFIKKLKSNLSTLLPNAENLGSIFFETHKQALLENKKGMSTISVLFFNKSTKKFFYLNIGDTRIYQFTNQFMVKITNDDSLFDKSNILTKCLGLNSLTIEDFLITPILTEGNFLMCSDGFYTLMLKNLKVYFETYNFRRARNIQKKLSNLQRRMNNDDSSYILIKNEV